VVSILTSDYIHTYIHTHIHTYTYIHTYIHIYTHTYIHTYKTLFKPLASTTVGRLVSMRGVKLPIYKKLTIYKKYKNITKNAGDFNCTIIHEQVSTHSLF
jgi:hypothetical protein